MYLSIHTAVARIQYIHNGLLSFARTLLLQCAMTFMLLPFSLSAWGVTSIQVIGHSAADMPHADKPLLANIFMRRVRVNKQGKALVPVNLPVDHPLRSIYSEILFGQQPQAMEQYWNEQYFKGISPPFVVSSMEAVRRFVAGTPGAVGYVINCQDDDRAEVLLKIPLSVEQTRKISGLCQAQ